MYENELQSGAYKHLKIYKYIKNKLISKLLYTNIEFGFVNWILC